MNTLALALMLLAAGDQTTELRDRAQIVEWGARRSVWEYRHCSTYRNWPAREYYSLWVCWDARSNPGHNGCVEVSESKFHEEYPEREYGYAGTELSWSYTWQLKADPLAP